jgi:hypothetical protein
MDGGQKEPWEVTSAPFDDPDMAPFAGPEPPEPGVLDPGCYWRLRPGEPLDEITELPRHQHDQPVVFFGGPQRRLLLDTPHGRKILAAAGSCAGVPAENVAQKIVVIYALHRATGHIDDADRFLVVRRRRTRPSRFLLVLGTSHRQSSSDLRPGRDGLRRREISIRG